MCRIAGIISKKLSGEQVAAKVGIMCAALMRGGPDDQGIYADKKANLVIGHRRLSIIDLSSMGHQPMADIQKKAWITFNGEIYNFPELKEQLLRAGVKFATQTDTEVILAAYLHWGTPAFSKLRGMFAFALYDVTRSVTYLVRDTAGIKPLYYHIDGEQLSFASEVKAFRAAGVATSPDPGWPVRFLAFGHIPEPYTTLKNVYSLEKGHLLSWDHQNSTYTVYPYTGNPPGITYITDPGTAKEQIRSCLRRSVKRQLLADAPIGVFLSGGTDSSILALLAAEQRERLKTISIYFNEKRYDERAYQNAVEDRLGGEKHAYLVQRHDFDRHFSDIISAMDMPTTDGINTWFISKYARQDGLKAVLSGVGADELFGGYPSFKRIRHLQHLRKIPSAFLGAANYLKTDKYRKIAFLIHNRPVADYLLLRGLFVPRDIAKILDTDTRQVNEILFGENSIPDLGSYDEEHAAWFETHLYMQNQLLRDTDVMGMGHGLEIRIPFLDEDFRQLAQSLSPGIRFNKDRPKKILVDSFSDLLPAATWDRPKMGFTFPLQEWITGHTEINNISLYNGKAAKNAAERFSNGLMHWSKIFALYQVQLHA